MKEHGSNEENGRMSELSFLLETFSHVILDDGIKDKIKQLNLGVEAEVNNNLINISLSNLLNEGKKIIFDNNLNKCPLCENNIDNTEAIEKIDKKLQSLSVMLDNISKIKDRYSETLEYLQKTKSAIVEFQSSLQFSKIDFSSQIESLKKVSKTVDTLNASILLGKDSFMSINYDTFKSIDHSLSEIITQSYEKVKSLNTKK